MRTLLTIPMIILFLSHAGAQTTEKGTDLTISKEKVLKEHVCTGACADGEHVYACGEQGHTCSGHCAKVRAKQVQLKEHACTNACTDGAHAYACGEIGHQCSGACKKAHKTKLQEHDHSDDQEHSNEE